MKPETYPTAHQLAKQLLEGPDHITIIPWPMFDMPGQSLALPVQVNARTVEGRDVIMLTPFMEEPTDETISGPTPAN